MLKQYVALQARLAARKNKGQSLAEYGLILALVAVFCIGALQVLGGSITQMLTGLASTIGGIGTG